MEEQFQDIEGCEVITDDLIVRGKDDQEHDTRLKKDLDRACEVHLKLNKKKCKIRVQEVSYIGHTLTADGIKPNEKKVKALIKMPSRRRSKICKDLLV